MARIGLGVIDTDLCLWGENLPPESEQWLYLVPALPTIKMKTGIYPQPSGEMAPAEEVEPGGGVVCAINRWVSDNPILAGAGLLAAALLFGGAGGQAAVAGRRATARRRR